MCKYVYWVCLTSLYLFPACYPTRTPIQKEAREYQYGKRHEDTSMVYQLPYAPGTTHRVVQGYYSRYTHKYRAAVDFKMKIGTPVLAASAGIVIRIKDDSDQGGWNKKYRPDANYIVLAHGDSIRTSYRHLKYNGTTVHLGDTVQAGQQIGWSGNTGYTLSPHLHFMVSVLKDGQWNAIPCRFQSESKVGYLRPLHKYTSVNRMKNN